MIGFVIKCLPDSLARKLGPVLNDSENKALWNSSPVLFIHLACLALPLVGISKIAVAICLTLFWVRVFALTAGYHRYFAHRSFKTSRVFQFLLGFAGASSAQLGPLWWAAHHRHHHDHSDTKEDIHSPLHRGFFWSHIGWVLSRKYFQTDYSRVQDLAKYPELRFLDRYHVLAPALLMISLYGLGQMLGPTWNTSGPQLLLWGFFLSTVLVYQVTFCVNSVTHVTGKKRFNTGDESRNCWWLALLTGGEGWHNNHHRYPVSARQGLYWWEIDLTYYGLKLLACFRLIHDLKTHPESIRKEGRQTTL